MLLSLMTELRDDETRSKLPLSPKLFMVIEEFDNRNFCPTYNTRKTKGRIQR